MKIKNMEKIKENVKGVTMVTLVVTIIILLLLATVTIGLTVGENRLFKRGEQATEEHIKQEAKEAMNMKISGIQIQSYAENKTLPNLQYLANKLCEDEEMDYVLLESKRQATLDKIDVTNADSIFTKIKKYPYEFEIDSELKLASIDGVKIATNSKEIENLKTEISEKIDSQLADFKEEIVAENNKRITELQEEISNLKTQNNTLNTNLNNITSKYKSGSDICAALNGYSRRNCKH